MSDIQIVRPNVLAAMGASVAPIRVVIQAPALFQLLEFALHSQERVLGTLVGSRSDDGAELEVRDAFVVPHHEDGDELSIEDQHHKTLYQLHRRAHPKDTVLGWFSTTDEIDTFTALVHNLYSQGPDSTFPHPALHLTMESVGAEGELNALPKINTYIGTPMGVTGAALNQLQLDKSPSFIFTPVANDVKFDVQERSVLEYASKSVHAEQDQQLDMESVDLHATVSAIEKVDSLIDTTLQYVERVESGEIAGDEKLAKLLLTQLQSSIKSLNPEHLEKVFTSHIQDTLMVEYLASAVKTQLELSAKLTLA